MKANKTKSVAASILVATSLVLGAAPANSAFGSDVNKKVNPSASNQNLNINYVGESNGYVFIRISLSQPKEQKSYLEIMDLGGENLYRETVTAKEFSRIIKVSPDEVASLKVVYTSNGTEAKKTFAINTSFYTTYNVAEVAE